MGFWLAAGSAAVFTGAVGAMAWAVRGRASTVLAPSRWRGDRARRVVALTFDDGPSESTPEILEILAAHGVRATFFFCGSNAERLPEVARAVREAGHEIASHGYAHRLYCLRSAEFIERDLRRAQEAIELAAGVRPRWLRPPFGVRWFGLRSAQRQLGLTGVMWTVIGRDWRYDAARVTRRVLRLTCNGAVICLHDGRELRACPDIASTVESLRHLLPELQARGYEFVSVSELLG
jgi:peptidoglycan-N-acetylglucosamine deacetylase